MCVRRATAGVEPALASVREALAAVAGALAKFRLALAGVLSDAFGALGTTHR